MQYEKVTSHLCKATPQDGLFPTAPTGKLSANGSNSRERHISPLHGEETEICSFEAGAGALSINHFQSALIVLHSLYEVFCTPDVP